MKYLWELRKHFRDSYLKERRTGADRVHRCDECQ
jgi:hypothetical protein